MQTVDFDQELAQRAEVDPIGETVVNYRIVARLGEGGMGVVYRAVHALLQKQAALKVLRGQMAAQAEWRERFFAEANVLSRLNHHNIVKVENVDTLKDGRLCLVMELLEGKTLREALDGPGELTPWEAVTYTIDVLSALASAHSVRVYHRDIKPENIFIVEEPFGQPYAKVMDFGLATFVPLPTESRGELPQARESARVGTPQYVSPEQSRGMPPSPEADLYSVGTVLYELLSRQLPLSANSAPEWVWAQQSMQPTPLENVTTGLPKRLCALVNELLRKDPYQRPHSATVVRNRLEEIRERMDPPSSHERTMQVRVEDAAAALHATSIAPTPRKLKPLESAVTLGDETGDVSTKTSHQALSDTKNIRLIVGTAVVALVAAASSLWHLNERGEGAGRVVHATVANATEPATEPVVVSDCAPTEAWKEEMQAEIGALRNVARARNAPGMWERYLSLGPDITFKVQRAATTRECIEATEELSRLRHALMQ